MMEKVLLLVLLRKGKKERVAGDVSEEMRELIYSSRGNVVDSMVVYIDRPAPNYFLKKGKLAEIRERVKALKPRSVITNIELSPVQLRNLEEFLNCKVVDRTGLILDIFAQHAKSKDGKVQVELAQLTYLMPRLSAIWEKFSRLGGGIGTRGPGEQILERDRRKIKKRIGKLKSELERLRTHRTLIRKSRQRKDCIIVSIVGYTNSGKSTLLKHLTGADVLIEDQLFATLDPITRRYELPNGKNILFTDTVGLLLDLPHGLIQSFHSTLEEINEAQFIITLMDAANTHYQLHYNVVQSTLAEIGAQEKKQLIVFNKADKINEEMKADIRRIFPDAIFISALCGEGVDVLVDQIQKEVSAYEN